MRVFLMAWSRVIYGMLDMITVSESHLLLAASLEKCVAGFLAEIFKLGEDA